MFRGIQIDSNAFCLILINFKLVCYGFNLVFEVSKRSVNGPITMHIIAAAILCPPMYMTTIVNRK